MNEKEVYEKYAAAQEKAQTAHKAVRNSPSQARDKEYRAALREEYAAWIHWLAWRP